MFKSSFSISALFCALFLLVSGLSFGQSVLDPYKYIIVPKNFDFLKRENQYRVNTMTKYLFDTNGYMTLIEGEDYPEEVRSNPCIALKTNVLDKSNAFTTKLRVELTNCLDEVVFLSEEGTSKEKDFSKTYSESLKKAFVSIGELDYAYNPELAINSAAASVPVAASASLETMTSSDPVTPEEPATSSQPIATSESVSTSEPVAVTEPVTSSEPVSASEPVKASEPAVVAAAATTAAVASVPASNDVAASYGNENISFFLIDQGDVLAAYVNRSKSGTYAKGERIGTFEKTSLPNVYSVKWKGMDKDIEQTTGYFDQQGNLKIDVKKNGNIEILSFTKE